MKNIIVALVVILIIIAIIAIVTLFTSNNTDKKKPSSNKKSYKSSSNIEYNPCALGCIAYLHTVEMNDKTSPIGIWYKTQGTDTDFLTINQDGSVTYDTMIELDSQNTGSYSNGQLTIYELGQTYPVSYDTNTNTLNVSGLDSFTRSSNSFYSQITPCSNNDVKILNNGGDLGTSGISDNCFFGLIGCALTECCNSECDQCSDYQPAPYPPPPSIDDYIQGASYIPYFFPI